ncbi:MAG: hypothetical protein PCFJNLEI_03862 [Verrucomicrobiae bacterium]|nr:hypothetical protein [Verrucomicrobiae bacterium]
METIWLITLLVAMGIAMICVDFFLPGFVLGSIGMVLFLVALAICYRDYGLNWAAALFVAEAVLGIGAAFVSIRYGPETRTGKKMILSHEQVAQHASDHPTPELVGQTGIAHTMLRPSGTALIGDKRYDVVAESGMIERASAVEVIAIDGTRIIVRKI